MALLDSPKVIDLPPLRLRPANKFTDVAVDISAQFKDGNTDRTARGASFMALGELAPLVAAYACGVDDDKGTNNLTITRDTQMGIMSFNFLECSQLGGDLEWMRVWVDTTVADLASHALAYYATTIMLPPGHINLQENADDVGPGATILDCLGRVEEGLAERASNYQGQIMVPIRRLAELVSLQAIASGGASGGYVSPAGHQVIADAGHQGDNTIYGTTQLGYSIASSVDLNDYVAQFNRVHNDTRWMSEFYAIAVFNRNHTVKATVTGSSL